MKRFGLLMLVAVFMSALTIGTFNVLKVQCNHTTTAELVSSSSTHKTNISVNQQGDVVSSDFSDISLENDADENCYSSKQQAFYNCYHQQVYLNSFCTCFDNDPFSDIYRSSV